MRYRKKPVVVEAWLVRDLLNLDDEGRLPEPVAAAVAAGELCLYTEGADVKTLEGVMTAAKTDVLIQGVKGEFYPCKPDIFAATYEPAE